MFISTAYAQAAATTTDASNPLVQFLPLILILGVMYVLMFRPQQKKAKELKVQQSALRRGDRIVTAGGVIGTVSRAIDDNEVEVQIADEVKVRVLRSTISTILAKTEPAKAEKIATPKAPKAEPGEKADSGK